MTKVCLKLIGVNIKTINYKEYFTILIATAATAIATIILILGFRMLFLSDFSAIETHQMGNNVICYTYNSSIDCLQVEK